MKIQTKVTGFFLMVLAVFSYVLVWISTTAYRKEVNRLNAEVCRQRLQHIMSIIREQDNFFGERVYRNEKEARLKAMELIGDSMQNLAPSDESFPFIINENSRVIFRPKKKVNNIFPWSRYSTDELFMKNSGSIRFHTLKGERIIIYQAFPAWRWLVCYSYPANAEFYHEVYSGYYRQILAVLCCLVASIATLLWLIQKALAPLNDLVDTASAMAAGVFPKTDPNKTYSNNEIGILSRAFDEMAARIQESMRKLHQEVRERREKEHEIREMIDNSPLATVIVRGDWTFSNNEMFKTLFGYSSDNMERFDEWFKLSCPDGQDVNDNVREWKHLFAPESFGAMTIRVKCKNGRLLDVEVRHKMIGGQSLLIFNDLTDIKEAETRLRNTRNYLNQLFNSIRVILVAVNEKGIVTQWNQSMEKFTSIKAADAVGSKIWIIAPFLKHYRNDVEQTISSGKAREMYREIISFRKKRYYFDISITPLQHGDYNGAVIMLENTTELVRKSEQLMQAQKMETVGTLTGGLAHDFNNVLGGIKGSLSMINYYLANSPEETDEIKEFSGLAEKSITRATSMVEQLLTLSRKSQLTIKPTDLNKAVNNVLEICRGTFDKSVSITLSKPPGRAMIKADQTQIEQVLLNLLINAEHALTLMCDDEKKRGGTIEVTVGKTKPDQRQLPWDPEVEVYWKLSIKDNGVGIAPELKNKIFDPFFTTKARGKGTGLGLAMVYNIIDLHKGFIDVKSEHGAGSTFTVYLPEMQYDSELVAAEPEMPDIIPGEGLILIVDDEKAIRITAGKMLESLGYQVLTAENGEEGLEVFRVHQEEISAVLLDVAMPQMSGDEAYTRMKEIDPKLKVLLSSGFTNDSRVRKTLEAGADGFIKKPYSIAKLSRKIHDVLKS
jgi:PAS domain S-box-containing protein